MRFGGGVLGLSVFDSEGVLSPSLVNSEGLLVFYSEGFDTEGTFGHRAFFFRDSRSCNLVRSQSLLQGKGSGARLPSLLHVLCI